MDTKKLRQKILDLAIRGKLVPQDPNDEPASVLLERIKEEKERLIKEGKIKRSKKTTSSDTYHYRQLECVPFEIPNSWVWATLGDIGTWQAGGTPSRSNKTYYGGSIPWLKTGDLNDGLITDIPERHYRRSCCKFFCKNQSSRECSYCHVWSNNRQIGNTYFSCNHKSSMLCLY